MSLKRILLGTAIGGAVIAGVTYIRRLKKTSAELQTVTRVNIFKIGFKGLVLQVDVQIKNPSRTKFSIKFPFVKLLYKDSVIGTSQVVNQDIPIPAYGEAMASRIMITIPLMGVFSLGGGLLASLESGQEVKLDAITMTTIDLGIKKVPYQKTDVVTLKK
jgi:hypothetical protein